MKREGRERPAFRLPWAPVTNGVTLGFLALVVLLMALDQGVGRITLIAFVAVIVLLVVGWYAVRRRVDAQALTTAIEVPEGPTRAVVREGADADD